MNTLRDTLWLWGHDTGSFNSIPTMRIPGISKMPPAEAAVHMGIPNLFLAMYNQKPALPFDSYLEKLSPLRSVVWGMDSGEQVVSQSASSLYLKEIVRMADTFPNLTGAVVDDLFREIAPDRSFCRYEVELIRELRSTLNRHSRKLKLWAVLYAHDLVRPAGEGYYNKLREILAEFDGVTFWTWSADHLSGLERHFAQVESLIRPTVPLLLGCFMWDFSRGVPVPLAAMEHQCRCGRDWLLRGRICGMIFHSTPICDLDIAAVRWSREWIQRHGDDPVMRCRQL